MSTNIQVTYRHLPSEITGSIETLKSADLTVSIEHDKEEYFNFSGGPADVLIYIDQHLTETIIAGLLVPALYDSLKSAIKSTWKKIIQHYRQKSFTFQEDKNNIELNFKLNPDRTIEFKLRGDVDEQTINDTVENIFRYLRDKEKQDIDFQHPDYKDRLDTKPRIRMRYNPQTNKWEPVNFAEIEKLMNELRKRAEEEFDS